MDTKIKNYAGIAAIVLMAAVAVATVWFVYSYTKVITPTSFRSFNVTAEGKTYAIPDVAQFSFTVLTEGGTDLTTLQQENTAKANQAIAAVKADGVADKDIQTQGYTVQPRYQYCQPDIKTGTTCPPPAIVGYTIQQTVMVKARDFSKIGDMLSKVVSAGANSVSQLSFTLDDPTSAQNTAMAQAIEKAKAKAVSIAQAGDFELGRLLSIQEDNNTPSPIVRFASASVAVPEAAAPSPAVQSGSQEVDVSVTLQYEIGN
ncbi:SIMPL domain-containing protein [Patescibacteria group bacterium]|nr:SIMPL domain-containing protein [Patescibacteria group bacterium]